MMKHFTFGTKIQRNAGQIGHNVFIGMVFEYPSVHFRAYFKR